MNMPLDLSVASHLILLSDSEEFPVNFYVSFWELPYPTRCNILIKEN